MLSTRPAGTGSGWRLASLASGWWPDMKPQLLMKPPSGISSYHWISIIHIHAPLYIHHIYIYLNESQKNGNETNNWGPAKDQSPSASGLRALIKLIDPLAVPATAALLSPFFPRSLHFHAANPVIARAACFRAHAEKSQPPAELPIATPQVSKNIEKKNRAAKFIKHRHLWKKNTWRPSTQIVIGRITRWIPVVYWLLAIINSHVIFTVSRLKASGSNSAVTHDLLPLDLPKGMAPGITRRSAIICHLADPLWFACGFTYKGCVKKWHRAQNRLFHHHFHQFSSCSFEVCLFPDTHCCHRGGTWNSHTENAMPSALRICLCCPTTLQQRWRCAANFELHRLPVILTDPQTIAGGLSWKTHERLFYRHEDFKCWSITTQVQTNQTIMCTNLYRIVSLHGSPSFIYQIHIQTAKPHSGP